MTGLRHNDRSKVVVVTIPAANLGRAIKLIVVLVDFAGLEIKHLAFIKVNALDPLKSGTDSVFLVVLADSDEDSKAPIEKASVHGSSIVLTVGDGISDGAVSALKRFRFLDVEGSLDFVEAVRFSEKICEAVVINMIFVIEVGRIHLLNATDRFGDVI